MATYGKSDRLAEAQEASSLQIMAFVLWTGCVVVGVLGLALHYSRPHPPVKQAEIVQAELLNVELSSDPVPPPLTPPPVNVLTPPPLPSLVTPQAPPMIPVAEPNPAIAFALPVEGATRIVDAKQASHTRPENTVVANTAPPVQPLIYGQGEGRQPKPEYPARAARDGQEGVVEVRFTVAEDGRVIAAEPFISSPWALLNESAVRTVRERWHFPAGPVRIYQVPIRFQLSR